MVGSILGLAQPHKHLVCCLVDITHMGYLLALLRIIRLVDINLVDSNDQRVECTAEM